MTAFPTFVKMPTLLKPHVTVAPMPEIGPPPVHSVSWQDFDAMSQMLASQLRAGNIFPDCIVGIARGGCVVAVAMSHLLPPSEFCVISAKVHQTDNIRAEKAPVQVQSLAGPREFRGKKVLLVDDVLHTGATAQACHDFVTRSEPLAIYFTALLRDTFGIDDEALVLPCPVFTAGSVNAWVVFPWEPKAPSDSAK